MEYYTYESIYAILKLIDLVLRLCVALHLQIGLMDLCVELGVLLLARFQLFIRGCQLFVHVEQHVGHNRPDLVLNIKMVLGDL